MGSRERILDPLRLKSMKVIIAGSRSFVDIPARGSEETQLDWLRRVRKAYDKAVDFVRDAITNSGFEVTEVVSGGAQGIDTAGELWANREGLPIKYMPADWSQGRGAGFARNEQMAEYADALVAIWDGHSNGTRHMISLMPSKKTYVETIVS